MPSCSSLARLALCPHSLRYDVEGVETTSEMAERGNRIHQYLAYQNILLTEEETKLMLACKRIIGRSFVDLGRRRQVRGIDEGGKMFLFRGTMHSFLGSPTWFWASLTKRISFIDYRLQDRAFRAGVHTNKPPA